MFLSLTETKISDSVLDLRTVPTCVSVHIFCALCKALFTRHAHADTDMDAINYATKCMTKMKAKCSY